MLVVGRLAEQATTETQCIAYGLKRFGGQFLRDETNPRARLAEPGDYVVAVDEHLTTAGVDDAADDIDQRGLAGTVRAEQPEDLALVDLEVNVLEGLEATGIGLGQTLYRDH